MGKKSIYVGIVEVLRKSRCNIHRAGADIYVGGKDWGFF